MIMWVRKRWSALLYDSLWVLIVAVSVHDGYLVLLNRWTITRDEQNSVGRWLIAVGAGDVHVFLAAKFMGTIVVATVLLILIRTHARVAWFVCVVLATMQIVLFIYLNRN